MSPTLQKVSLFSKSTAGLYLQSSKGPEVTWGETPVACLVLNLNEEYRLHEQGPKQLLAPKWLSTFSGVWAEQAGMGLARQVPPVVIELKADASPVLVRQYSMSKEAKEGIRPHIQRHIGTRASSALPIPLEHSSPACAKAWD